MIPGGVMCQICRLWLADVTSLNEHYASAHPTKTNGDRERNFVCEIYDKRYAIKRSLRYHLATQHELSAERLKEIFTKK